MREREEYSGRGRKRERERERARKRGEEREMKILQTYVCSRRGGKYVESSLKRERAPSN